MEGEIDMVKYDNKNWLKLLFSFEGSVIWAIYPKVLFFTITSILITYFYPQISHVKVSPTPFTIIGGVLGFLLVFRTNTSYDRYWEGRKLWGEINNQTRNMAMKIINYCGKNHEKAERITNLQIAFINILKDVLRDEHNFEYIKKYIRGHELEELKKSKLPHILTASLISKELVSLRRSGEISDSEFLAASGNLDTLVNSAGGIERIGRTPIPVGYALHIKRVLFIFCLMFPFGFVDTIGWITVPVALFITYAFLGIEEIGVEIEDPFGTDANDLPINDITAALENGIEELKKLEVN